MILKDLLAYITDDTQITLMLNTNGSTVEIVGTAKNLYESGAMDPARFEVGAITDGTNEILITIKKGE